MRLEVVYSYAKAHKSFDEFKAAVDEYITGNPVTAVSNNEFQLIQVNDFVIADVSKSVCSTCGKHNNPFCSNPYHLDEANIY